METPEHWLSMREIFGDPDLGMPDSTPKAEEEYARGLSLMTQDDSSGAALAFQRADELGHPGAPRELAQWAIVVGDMDLWWERLARARERGDGRAASWLGQNEQDAPERRLAHLRFSDESGDPEGSRALGLALKESGDLDGAEAAFLRADERGSPSGSLALGILLRDARGDPVGAEAAFLRAEQRGHPKGPLNLIDIYVARGDLAAARAASERTLELAARHRTAFTEMQDPDFVRAVRQRPSGLTAASTSGSSCLVGPLLILVACGATVAMGCVCL